MHRQGVVTLHRSESAAGNCVLGFAELQVLCVSSERVCVCVCTYVCVCVHIYTYDLCQHEYVNLHMQVHNIVEFHAAVTQMVVDDDALCWGDFGERDRQTEGGREGGRERESVCVCVRKKKPYTLIYSNGKVNNDIPCTVGCCFRVHVRVRVY